MTRSGGTDDWEHDMTQPRVHKEYWGRTVPVLFSPQRHTCFFSEMVQQQNQHSCFKGKMMSWEMWMDLNCSFRSQTNPTWILEVEVCLPTFTRPIQTFPPIWNSSNVDTPSGNSQVETAGSDRQICAVLQGSLGYVCLELSKSLWKGTTNFLHEKEIEIIFIYMYIVWREVS